MALNQGVFATLSFMDTFESYDANLTLPDQTPWVDTFGTTVRDNNTASPFGGIDNQWLEITKVYGENAPNQTIYESWNFPDLTAPDSALVTLSFDVLFDSSLFTGPFTINMRGDRGIVNKLNILGAGRWPQIDLQLGDDLAWNTALHFDIIMNMTGSTVNYNGTTVADHASDVWVDGNNIVNDDIMNVGGVDEGTKIVEVGLWMYANERVGKSTVYLDNVAVRNNEAYAIPEPASAGLIALVSGGIWFVRRFFVT